MHIDSLTEPIPARRSDRGRIAKLLKRYPELSSAEADEIVTFIKTARHLDIGLLTTDDDVRPKLDAFMDAHKQHFQASLSDAAVIALAIAGAATVIALIELALG